MDDDRRISSNTNFSFSSPAATEAAAPVKRKARGAKVGLGVKRMDLVDEDINDSAEEFIKRFRENLLLQRLESIENYKQMLARGV